MSLSRIKQWFKNLKYQPIALLFSGNLKEMWLEEINNRVTLEKLLVESDRQRDQLIQINLEQEVIIKNLQEKIRNLKKELRKT